ncbi:MAG: hypothetical protein U1E65_28210 [Myxococcota bacterium]
MRGALCITVLALSAVEPSAHAIRFSLGVETGLTPITIDAAPAGATTTDAFRLELRPVLDVELSRSFAFGVYTPFTLLRGNEVGTGAESVFALGASLRKALISADAPEEILLYGTLRGGLGTSEGRAGLYLGAAIGASATWLDVGRGIFAELGAGHIGIARGSEDRPFPAVDRWLFTLSVGFVFRLGGEEWRVEDRRREL